MDFVTIVIVILYLAINAYLGIQGYRRTHTAADYLLAGREANPIVMALSYGSTFISTAAIIGFGGISARFGMGMLWLCFLNIFVGVFLAFVFLGGHTRRMGHHLGAHTFPEFLGKRYNSRFLQVFSALIIFLFMPVYAMAVIKGGAEFISLTFNIPTEVGLYIFALIVAAYVIPGGLKSVMFTEALQAMIMLIGMAILLAYTYVALGGVINAHQALTDMAGSIPEGLRKIGHQGWTQMPAFGWSSSLMPAAGTPRPPDGYDMWWIMVSSIIMGVAIGVLAQPQLIVRFMTVKSQQALNRAVPMGGLFILAMVGVAYIVGPLSNVFFAKHEAITCRIVDDAALLYPGADGQKPLAPVPPDASEEVKANAKRFVAYHLPGELDSQTPHYVLATPAMNIERGAGKDGMDILKPGLISMTRSVDLGTTMKGNVDRIVPLYIGSAMPKWFNALFLLTLLAAAMSTLSSQFHAIGTSFGHDIVMGSGTTGTVNKRSILVTRAGVVVGLILSLALGAVLDDNVIAAATSVFFGLCASAFLPAFVAGLFWRRMNKPAALTSVVVGSVVSIYWLAFMNESTAGRIGLCKALFARGTLVPEGWSVTWAVVDPIVVALPVSIAAAAAVALLTHPMDKTFVDYVYGASKKD